MHPHIAQIIVLVLQFSNSQLSNYTEPSRKIPHSCGITIICDMDIQFVL